MNNPTYEELDDLAKWVQHFQPHALDIMRREGFVLDNLDDRWQKLVFTLYTDLCEIENRARQLYED